MCQKTCHRGAQMALSLQAPFPWLYLCPVLKPFVKLEYPVVSLVAIWCVPPGGSEEGRSVGAEPPPHHPCLHPCNGKHQPPHWTPLTQSQAPGRWAGTWELGCVREEAMRMGVEDRNYWGVSLPPLFRQDAIWGRNRKWTRNSPHIPI